jgi:hypothetical protein
MRRRLVVLLGTVAAACAALFSLPASGANFASKTKSTASVTTDSTANYLRLFSDATDPDLVLLGYATKRNSNPLVYAATGVDDSLAVALGGYKNTNNTTIARAFSVKARSPLPAGISSLTVTATLLPDPGGKQPLAGYAFTNALGLSPTSSVTLGPGDKRWCSCPHR